MRHKNYVSHHFPSLGISVKNLKGKEKNEFSFPWQKSGLVQVLLIEVEFLMRLMYWMIWVIYREYVSWSHTISYVYVFSKVSVYLTFIFPTDGEFIRHAWIKLRQYRCIYLAVNELFCSIEYISGNLGIWHLHNRTI